MAKKVKYFSKKFSNEYGKWDSEFEFKQFLYLKHLEDIGEISDLQRQVRFEIIPKLTTIKEVKMKTKVKYVERIVERAAHYTCDFTYFDRDGVYVIYECKSKATAASRDYPLRKKLIKKVIDEHNKSSDDKWAFKEVMQ